jgi:hypothetical protein
MPTLDVDDDQPRTDPEVPRWALLSEGFVVANSPREVPKVETDSDLIGTSGRSGT